MSTTTVLDRFRLDGKVAIVTGGSSGLGVAFGKALAEAGADLVLAARRADRLEHTRRLVGRCGRSARAVVADLTAPEAAVVDAAVDEFGHVDVLVNNAGNVSGINVNGSYWMAQACGKVMKPGTPEGMYGRRKMTAHLRRHGIDVARCTESSGVGGIAPPSRTKTLSGHQVWWIGFHRGGAKS
jgi:NAD(P)-dependent dehydrogenase (short-subunit alcohol dehydrogenase family)